MSQYTFSVAMNESFETALSRTVEALKQEGFGVLTEIDVPAVLKEKLGLDHLPYKILGACNPQFAHRALDIEPDIGALLPCNVVVREEDGGQISVVFMDPHAVMAMVDNAAIAEIGDEVRERLTRVAHALET